MNALQYREYGSEYHWINNPGKEATNCIRPKTILFSTGRAALISLLRHGIKEYAWKRIWLPQYFCPEVSKAIHGTGIDIGYYFDSPLDAPIAPRKLGSSDIVFINNLFGVKTCSSYAAFYDLGVPIIEDHTHDPWSTWANTSSADYAVASYRKVLPIPDGAGLWSPKGKDIISCYADNSAQISDKLQAMLLKSSYLVHGWQVKNDFLALYHRYAESLGNSCSYISLLSRNILTTFPWDNWRQQRKRNYLVLENDIVDNEKIHVVRPMEDNCCPYSFVIIFDTKGRRELVRQSLLEKAIYPAILWPRLSLIQQQIDIRSVDISERMISLHIDGRYTTEDMVYISSIIRGLI